LIYECYGNFESRESIELVFSYFKLAHGIEV